MFTSYWEEWGLMGMELLSLKDGGGRDWMNDCGKSNPVALFEIDVVVINGENGRKEEGGRRQG